MKKFNESIKLFITSNTKFTFGDLSTNSKTVQLLNGAYKNPENVSIDDTMTIHNCESGQNCINIILKGLKTKLCYDISKDTYLGKRIIDKITYQMELFGIDNKVNLLFLGLSYHELHHDKAKILLHSGTIHPIP